MTHQQSEWICSNRHRFLHQGGRPTQCHTCGSRLIYPAGRGAVGPGPASSGYSSPVSLTSGAFKAWFSIMFWMSAALSLAGLVCIGAGWTGGLAAIAIGAGLSLIGIILNASSIPFGITAGILGLIALHRAWRAVQPLREEEPSMPTPGKAVGFIFIPFFNYYWIFVATVGLARRLNRLAQLRSLPGRLVSEGVPLALCIIIVASPLAGFLSTFLILAGMVVPPLGLLVAVPALALTVSYMVLAYIFFIQSINAANRLAAEEANW